MIWVLVYVRVSTLVHLECLLREFAVTKTSFGLCLYFSLLIDLAHALIILSLPLHPHLSLSDVSLYPTANNE